MEESQSAGQRPSTAGKKIVFTIATSIFWLVGLWLLIGGLYLAKQQNCPVVTDPPSLIPCHTTWFSMLSIEYLLGGLILIVVPFIFSWPKKIKKKNAVTPPQVLTK